MSKPFKEEHPLGKFQGVRKTKATEGEARGGSYQISLSTTRNVAMGMRDRCTLVASTDSDWIDKSAIYHDTSPTKLLQNCDLLGNERKDSRSERRRKDCISTRFLECQDHLGLFQFHFRLGVMPIVSSSRVDSFYPTLSSSSSLDLSLFTIQQQWHHGSQIYFDFAIL